ncbi:hypothetical protein MVES_000450 [Malassezia vespertilionis]|uniref:Vacuolar sorting protein Vps3844 C-terminal domain-containing protein n=1 Tax=Malassezia vespertilionis TaxID=2020962 RepID=A0A2N1JG36_9BASI|nr:hypothetical protein MVES_000450 [Malassezia vespertilionis]
MLYVVIALLAPLAVLAESTLYLSGVEDASKSPLQISAQDAHRVLAHHLGVDSNVLPTKRQCGPQVWHHLPADIAEYDATTLFEPMNLFPASMQATHTVSSAASGENFEALAQLYAGAAQGASAWLGQAKNLAGDVLGRFDQELTSLRSLARSDAPSMESVQQMHLDALADIRTEYGAKSATFERAKAQLKETVNTLVQNWAGGVGPIAIVHTDKSGAPLYTRSKVRANTTHDRLHPFVADAPSKDANACHTSPDALRGATNDCNGHGEPKESAKGGKKCWRCACRATKTAGKTQQWTGAACEKEDVASFVLLIIGSIGALFVATVFSIALLYREGAQELPGTLSSIALPPS